MLNKIGIVENCLPRCWVDISNIYNSLVQRLINENHGLDYYLLKTPVNDIYSRLGLKLKREILLCLAKKGSEEQQLSDNIYSKYEAFKVPEEVALWHGLPWKEAVHHLFVLGKCVNKYCLG